MTITVRALTRLREAETLADGWDALAATAPRATPFSSAAWNLACWGQLGHGRLLVLAFERGGTLVGVAPLYREPGPWRRLRWIGTLSGGDW